MTTYFGRRFRSSERENGMLHVLGKAHHVALVVAWLEQSCVALGLRSSRHFYCGLVSPALWGPLSRLWKTLLQLYWGLLALILSAGNTWLCRSYFLAEIYFKPRLNCLSFPVEKHLLFWAVTKILAVWIVCHYSWEASFILSYDLKNFGRWNCFLGFSGYHPLLMSSDNDISNKHMVKKAFLQHCHPRGEILVGFSCIHLSITSKKWAEINALAACIFLKRPVSTPLK